MLTMSASVGEPDNATPPVHGPIRLECGCSPDIRSACGCGRRARPQTPVAAGDRVGTLTATDGAVYRRSTVRGRRVERWVDARCDCGAMTTMRAPAWFAAARTGVWCTCGGAAHAAERAARTPRGAAHANARFAGAVPSSVWARVRANAAAQCEKHERRGEDFAITITHQDLAALWVEQGGRCRYTGLPLSLATQSRATTASLDRIDSSEGYMPGNVQFVHKIVNVMKLDLSEPEFLRLATAVARHASHGLARADRLAAQTTMFPDAKTGGANIGSMTPPTMVVPPWCLGAGARAAVVATVLGSAGIARNQASTNSGAVVDLAPPDGSLVPPLLFVAAAPTERARNGRRYARAVYRCQACAAGTRFETRVDNVRSGNTRSCGCLADRTRAAVRAPVAGVIGRTYWAEVQRNARTRGIAFDLMPDTAWAQYLRQGGRCALTGWRIDFAGTHAGTRRQTASLDRIDPARGYAPDNVMWTHKQVNVSRFGLSVAAFLGWCTAVASYRRLRHGVGAEPANLPLFVGAAA